MITMIKPHKRGHKLVFDNQWMVSIVHGEGMYSEPREDGAVSYTAVEVAVFNPSGQIHYVGVPDVYAYADVDWVYKTLIPAVEKFPTEGFQNVSLEGLR